MKIAVLADTHDRPPLAIYPRLAQADEIWHLGDVTSPALLAGMREIGPPVRVVRGNCDAEESWPMQLNFAMEGRQVRLVHIPPKTGVPGVDLLLHGHTHVPRDEQVGKTRFLNPGCITRPNRGAPASFAWLTLRAGHEIEWVLIPTR